MLGMHSWMHHGNNFAPLESQFAEFFVLLTACILMTIFQCVVNWFSTVMHMLSCILYGFIILQWHWILYIELSLFRKYIFRMLCSKCVWSDITASHDSIRFLSSINVSFSDLWKASGERREQVMVSRFLTQFIHIVLIVMHVPQVLKQRYMKRAFNVHLLDTTKHSSASKCWNV